MSSQEPSKSDVDAILKRLRTLPANKVKIRFLKKILEKLFVLKNNLTSVLL